MLEPRGFNHRYDLVLDLDGDFIRAQCKTGRLRNGVIVFNSESVRCNTKTAHRRGYVGDADVFLVHCPDESELVQCGYFDSADAVWRNDKGDVLDEPELWAELPVVPTN